MRAKQQVVFDISSEKFKYLHRAENKIKNRIDVDILNKRLNEIKKLNTYSNIKMIFFSITTVVAFVIISLNF